MAEETAEALAEQQAAADLAAAQATEKAEAEAEETRQTEAKAASEETKGRVSDDKGDPAKLASDYKKLQGEYTRTTQELAQWRRQAAEFDADKPKREDAAKKAATLEALAANPKFKAWAEQELMQKRFGAENWDELTPQQQLQHISELAERKAEEIAEKKMAALRQEYEPAREKAAQADAAQAAAVVAEKYGDLWTENLDAFKELVAQYDKASETNPEIRKMMNHPTEEMIETIFLRAIGPRIREIGKKAYASDLEKKHKAQLAGKGGNALATAPPIKSMADAFIAAKQEHNIKELGE